MIFFFVVLSRRSAFMIVSPRLFISSFIVALTVFSPVSYSYVFYLLFYYRQARPATCFCSSALQSVTTDRFLLSIMLANNPVNSTSQKAALSTPLPQKAVLSTLYPRTRWHIHTRMRENIDNTKSRAETRECVDFNSFRDDFTSHVTSILRTQLYFG